MSREPRKRRLPVVRDGRVAPVALTALVIAAGCGSDPTGLNVELALGDFASRISTLRVGISADPGGFMMPADAAPEPGVTLANATDPNGAPALVVTFSTGFQFQPQMTFRLATGNRAALTVAGQALAFDADGLIAGGEDAGKPLPPGGLGTLAIALAARSSPIGVDSRTTDLAGAPADFTVNGGQTNASLGPVVACDVDGDGQDDLVIGAPGAEPNTSLGATGAVYVVFGGGTAAAIDLSMAASGENHFYGRDSGDNLGAAVACADLNEDGAADIVAGAPRAGNGQGRVYVVFGGGNIRNRSINLASPTAGANVQWATAVANAELGRALFAGDLDGDGAAEVVAAAPGSAKVHVFSAVAPVGAAIDAELPDHPTFTGVPAGAIAIGDFDVSGAPFDLALADPSHRPPNATDDHGVVYVFRNVAPATAGNRTVATAELTILGEPRNQLGAALVAADVSGNGVDLIVGAPGAADGTGAIFLFENDGDFFTGTRTAMNPALAGVDAGGRFGAALAVARSGTAGTTQLVVGAPAVGRGPRAGVGAAYLLGGGVGRTFRLLELLYGKEANDRLGAFVAGGPFNAGDMRADLIASAPFARGAATRSGVTYVRYR